MRIPVLAAFLFLLTSCSVDPMLPWFAEPQNPCLELPDTNFILTNHYLTKNIFVIVIDGPRWSETWGYPGQTTIPYQSQQLLPRGVFCTNFINDGLTKTVAGHAAITTGCYEELENSGAELPSHPSLMQIWLAKTGKPEDAAWVITSKDKLYVLGNCKDPDWQGKYLPSLDCGVSGPNSGYREDNLTVVSIKNIVSEHHPNIGVINFREPDYSAHQNNWDAYIRGIKSTDSLAWVLVNFIEADSVYAGNTTYFITNDHGRHLNEVQDGFVSHGDNCTGCRKISLLAIGPDFKQNISTNQIYNHVNLSATIAELLGLGRQENNGKVMWDLFE